MSRSFQLTVGSAVGTGKHPTAPVCERIVEDVIYRCNGWDQPWYLLDSKQNPLGSLVVDGSDVSIADAGSGTGFAAGETVNYRITYYDADLPNGGKESAPLQVSHTVGGSPSDINLTITDPATIQTQFNAARVYRQILGGTYKLLTTKTSSFGTPVTDSGTDLTSADQMVRRYRETLPPIFSWMEFYNGRLFGCTGKDSIVYFSQVRRVSGEGNVTDDFPSAQFIPVDPNGPGGHVVAVVAEWEQLIVFKQGAIYRLIGDSPEDMIQRVITTSRGCIAPHTIASINGVLVFLDEDGFYMLGRDGLPVQLAALEGSGGSPLADFWDGINHSSIHMAFSVDRPDLGVLELHLPMWGEPGCNRRVRYDYRSGLDRYISIDHCWFTRAALVRDASGLRYPLSLDDLGNVLQYDRGDNDGGSKTGKITAISATSWTVDVAGAGDERGALVVVRGWDGTRRDLNRVFAYSGTTISPLWWNDTTLWSVGSDRAVVGAIPARVRSHTELYGDPRFQKTVKDMVFTFDPQDAGELTLAIGQDMGEPVDEEIGIDLTDETGHYYRNLDGIESHRVQWELRNENPDEPWLVSAIDIQYELGKEQE